MRKTMLGLAIPLLLLGSCELKVGKDDTSAKANEDGNVAIAADDAEGISIKVPGFEGKMNIPGVELGGDHVDIEGMKLYPGSTLHGINVTDHKGAGNGAVDMRFTSPATPDKVAAYYAAAARDNGFTAINVTRSAAAATLTATNSGGDPMTITMTPDKAGTTGRILIKDKGGA